MLDWQTGQPNARFWVLKLIHGNFRPGDKLVDTQTLSGNVLTPGFVAATENGSFSSSKARTWLPDGALASGVQDCVCERAGGVYAAMTQDARLEILDK